MRNSAIVGLIVILASLAPSAALPAPVTPLDGLHFLVGTWKCTYRAGAAAPFPYAAAYSYDREGHGLREIASWTGDSDEELLAYDAQHGGWTVTVFDDHGIPTVMRGSGSDPNHFSYRSVYPDASIADTFDHISSSEYTLHAKVRSGGKTIASVDTCLRDRH